MTRLHIVHETTYRYRKPVRFGEHRLVLRPREGHDVNVAAMALELSPVGKVEWIRDIFGNSIATVTFDEPADRLSIRTVVDLDRTIHADAPHDEVRSVPYPVVYDVLERSMTEPYVASSFDEDKPAVETFVHDTMGFTREGDVAAVLPRLNAVIHERFRYRRREQKGVQTPAETLALGSGSCRDKATLMMECARALGIAARFASGYLDCPASEVGRAATHAWVEIYLPHNGWCGFDPTLGETTSLKHVVVGVSNHPRGVMPISGKFTGDAGDYLGLDVSVQITRG